ncbi:hypothetical protein J2W83_004281 [Pseudomonas hunanensis]|uniref:Uncharacterized protein n=1 Tax=Pseudomonas hunanensis TaxID=1247546 RepID=A0ACC6K828_9PSED|nr:hypothetical protein [Pseudomonas hunanensis]MDR6714645.1 hypothetical protein [Pseudomonas hunanensis]
MTISSTAQSNAFNFLSFLQHSVDPRTGQYTLGIELPELVGNDLSGPSLPLRLGFNPMNDQDSGFGHGWSLNLSQYVPATNMLSLHTGDSFKVTGSGDQPDIRERKLETFHFHKDAAERFRVVHKSGLVEVLESRGPSTNRVALPTRVEAPSGHWIELSYGDYYGAPCLTSIIDGSGVKLLALSYSDGQVLIDLHPEAGPGGTPLARYQVKLDKRGRANKRLPFEVVLPSEDNASWRFEYEHFEDRNLQQLACLKTVHTPVGGTERIEYLDDGHRFPEAANPSLTPAPLPRVTRHVIEPGFDQPDMVTEYAYTTNNFLGRGATGVVWREDGEDNLYQFAGTGFSYGSTVSYLQAGKALRTVSRSFNRFHLLTLQRSEEAGCIEETETTYPEVEGRSFEQQPSYFQLPHKVLKRWKLASDQTKYREESLLNSYDIHGNLVEETQANGIRTTYAYYPSAGEQGKDEEGKPVELCPADPHGFVRTIKEMTIHPAAAAEGEAPTLRTRYRYAALAPLGQATQSSAWLVAKEEDHLQVEAEQEILLRRTQRTYLDKPDTPFQHGRVDFQLETLRHGADRRQDKTSRTSYFYSLIKDDNDQQSLIQTKTTVQGHDLAQKSLYSAHSRYTGLHVRSQDLNGVYIHQRYDAMRRLVTQTIAPGTAFEASQHYQYNLSSAGQQPSQISTDVKGVRTRTWFDGYNRTLWEEREVEVEDTRTADAASARQWFKVSETRYDSVGRTSAQVTYDHYQDRQLALTSRFEYDGWGDVCKTTGADGVIQRRERSPFGAEGDIIKTWQERANQPGVRQQLQVSEYNRFGKPLHDRRLDVDEQPAGSLEYYYDGLGRCVRDVRTLRDPLATRAAPIIRSQRYSYDVWGRMTRNERANCTSLVRHFASHTTNALTTRLELLAANAQPGAGQTICARQFDGLERLSSLSVGPRTEQYTYQNEQVLVHTHTRASGRTYTFSYQPELTSQPTAISWKADAQAEFGYAKDDAAITRAKNSEGERLYTYTDQGFVSQEAWQGTTAADNYTIEHRMSVQGRPYQRSSSNGEQTLHTYDPQGRLKTTVQGNLHATFSYDDDGRLATTLTTDTASDRTVTCVQTYDSLGREHTRTLSLDDGTEQTLQLTWRDDDQLHQRSLHQGGNATAQRDLPVRHARPPDQGRVRRHRAALQRCRPGVQEPADALGRPGQPYPVPERLRRQSTRQCRVHLCD